MFNFFLFPGIFLIAPTYAQSHKNNINLDLASITGYHFVSLVFFSLWCGFYSHCFIWTTQAMTADGFLKCPVHCTLFLPSVFWNFDFINHSFLKCFRLGLGGIKLSSFSFCLSDHFFLFCHRLFSAHSTVVMLSYFSANTMLSPYMIYVPPQFQLPTISRDSQVFKQESPCRVPGLGLSASFHPNISQKSKSI